MKLIWKILIPLLITVIAVDGILVYQNITGRMKSFTERSTYEMEANYRIITNFMKKQEEKLLALATQMANSPEIQKAFASGDRQLLFRLIKPGFQKLKKQGLISTMAFFMPPAKSYLFAHRLESYNQDASKFRHTIVAVNKEKKPVFGVEAGRSSLPVRGIAPISYSGKHIGAVDFVRHLNESFLMELRELVRGELSIYVSKKKAKQMKNVKFGENAPEGFLAYSSLSEKILPIDPNVYKKVLQTGEKIIVEVSDEGHSYDVLIAPLFDFKGDVTALIEMRLIKDPVLAEIAKTRNLGLLYGIVILVISSLLIWQVVFRFITKPINQLNQVADAISLGDFSKEIKIETKDEIGDLGQAIERMKASLQAAIERLRKRK